MSVRRTLAATLATLTATGLLTACGTSDAATDEIAPKGQRGTGINIGPDQHRITEKKIDAISAKVPAAVRERGTLRLGASADASPPLGFYATDDRTRIGSEIDMATLIADTLGLKPEFEEVSWENLFVGLDSSKFDGVLSNVTVTEERKEKYDFATYRLDNIAFEAKKGSGWKVKGPKGVAGKTVAVASGTNQEKILLDCSPAGSTAISAPARRSTTTWRRPASPRSSARCRAAATGSRGRSPPPRRRTAAWSRRTRPPSTTSSTTARTPRC